MKRHRYSDRLVDYYERDFVYQFGNHPRIGNGNVYCIECNSNMCKNKKHHRTAVGVITRIPKKNATNYKKKKFLKFLKKDQPHIYEALTLG